MRHLGLPPMTRGERIYAWSLWAALIGLELWLLTLVILAKMKG